jgi:threonine dehydratase
MLRRVLPVTAADVLAASTRIQRWIVPTPLVPSAALSEAAGCEVWLKLENRQHTGSFKPRGALNKLLTLSPSERDRGIVAASAGNHALGVAYACHVLGLSRADLFVQRNASPAKLSKLRRYAVTVHLVGDSYEAAQQAALLHAETTGATYVSAYDDPAVVAGQGTVGLEILEALPDVDAVLVPVGGGALIGGIAVVVKAASPAKRMLGVNPEASPSALQSLQQGRALDPFDHGPTLAHGLAGGFGRTGFAIARELVERVLLVSEHENACAMAALIDSEQVLAEPSGAVAVAAALAHKAELSGRVVLVVSGGNIDSATLRAVLSDAVT